MSKISGHVSPAYFPGLWMLQIKMIANHYILSNKVNKKISELSGLLDCNLMHELVVMQSIEHMVVKIWEAPLSWLAKCSFPVAVRLKKAHGYN